LDELAFHALTNALEAAGLEYARLHRAITIFLISKGGGSDSEGLADITLDRVAQKIQAGETVRNFVSYSTRFAGNVFHEHIRDREKFRKVVRELAYLEPDVQEFEEVPNLYRGCQEACIKRESESDRQLMMDYYVNTRDRTALAAERGILLATLRTQIHRLSQRLKKCFEDCRRSA
jgi:DNA-directed RNA polymerase specialized sigma24 family protein